MYLRSLTHTHTHTHTQSNLLVNLKKINKQVDHSLVSAYFGVPLLSECITVKYKAFYLFSLHGYIDLHACF